MIACILQLRYNTVWKGGEKVSTDAKRKANSKYISSQDNITIRTPKGTKERWKGAAEERNKSLNQFIVESVEKELNN